MKNTLDPMAPRDRSAVARLRRWQPWLLGCLTPATVVAIEASRLMLGIIAPVRFLLLFGTAAFAASLGGVRVGLLNGATLCAYLLYAVMNSFAPPTLSEGPIRLLLGWGVVLATVIGLGWTRDQNNGLIRDLQISNAELETARRH